MNSNNSIAAENDRRAIQQRMVQLVAEAYQLGIDIAKDLPNTGVNSLMDEALSELGKLPRSTDGTKSLEMVTRFMVIYLSEAIDFGLADARGRAAPSIESLLEKTRTLIGSYQGSVA